MAVLAFASESLRPELFSEPHQDQGLKHTRAWAGRSWVSHRSQGGGDLTPLSEPRSACEYLHRYGVTRRPTLSSIHPNSSSCNLLLSYIPAFSLPLLF
ncbi:unnamed protein product [Gadus morhua 'NCC']